MQFIPSKTKQIFKDLKETLKMTTAGHRKLFYWSVFLWAVRGIGKILIPVIAAIVMTQIQKNLPTKTLTALLIFWIIVSAFWEQIIEFIDQVFWDWVEQSRGFCTNHLFSKSFKTILNFPTVVLENRQSSKVISTVDSLNNQLSYIVLHSLRIFTWSISWIGAAIILIGYKPSFALVAFICWLGSWYTDLKIEKKYCKDGDLEKMRLQNDAEKTDHVDNMTNINLLQIQDEVIKEIYDKVEKYCWTSFKWSMREDLIRAWRLIWTGIPFVYAGIVSAMEALDTGDIGRYVLLTGMVNVMVHTGSPILGFSNAIIKRLKSYHKVKEELTYDHTLDLKVGKESLPNGGKIELKHICFTYPETTIPVLEDLSLKIKQGDRVAIIGNSGAGKSTLINVMQHAYEIQSGEVIINGKNVRDISLKSLKEKLSYINQHAVFWRHKTIRENLLMFNPKATEKELCEALKSACLYDEIIKKEKGLDAKPTTLSAGQKQRLAIARTLLRKTPIIIMDEPTANLDTISQKKVLEGIKNISHGKGKKPTVIFASNVPAEIASADRILLLENGKIVEDGTPVNLMSDRNSKVFNRLKRYRLLFEQE